MPFPGSEKPLAAVGVDASSVLFCQSCKLGKISNSLIYRL